MTHIRRIFHPVGQCALSRFFKNRDPPPISLIHVLSPLRIPLGRFVSLRTLRIEFASFLPDHKKFVDSLSSRLQSLEIVCVCSSMMSMMNLLLIAWLYREIPAKFDVTLEFRSLATYTVTHDLCKELQRFQRSCHVKLDIQLRSPPSSTVRALFHFFGITVR